MDRRRLRAIGRRLARAYGTPPPPRHLPPLEELVLTVLSQHTSDTNRDRAYADLRRRFPSWDEVADAPLPALGRAIKRGGLGPTKAVRIRAILRAIRDGGVPLDERAFTGMEDGQLWDTRVPGERSTGGHVPAAHESHPAWSRCLRGAPTALLGMRAERSLPEGRRRGAAMKSNASVTGSRSWLTSS